MGIGTNLTHNRRQRKLISLLWIGALIILTFLLIYWEKTAILYILATLGVTALLVVVAISDLGGPEKNPTTTDASGTPGSRTM